MIYNNHEYSLFRQTSTPSGDDEDVLFGEREESQTDQQSLYYSSLEHFIEALHSVFPDMKGDGDTELLLDFGILDMQISEVSFSCFGLSLIQTDLVFACRTTLTAASFPCTILTASVWECASQNLTDFR